MKKAYYLFALTFAITFYSNAQLNNYKYVIVPKRFETFKKTNQYQTSTLFKYLFNNEGYAAIYDDALPEDLKDNGCLAVKAELIDNPSLFTTKVNIILKDCNGQVVFTSKEGRSKEKEYNAAYSEAIRKAFVSYKDIDYEYVPKKVMKEEPITVSFKNDVKSLANETAQKPVVRKKPEVVVKREETQEKTSIKSAESVTPKIKETNSTNVTSKKTIEVLYAQPIENGFQLVDSTPKIQYKLIETSVDNVFLASHGGKNGVILNKNGKWFFEYNDNGEKVLKELNIKF